ncbi:M protein, serotype 2.1-like [Hyperolius riggenbachi]|uniref:M protein, serotype 2.1-like n=1 Tax=Hyperolius riggenbachi TaxID=752182 RepID=UPI0035A2E9F9
MEQILEDTEESLSLAELEKIIRLLSDEVQSQREQLNKEKQELHALQSETAERGRSRELYVSLQTQTQDLHEALEAEEQTQQQLQEAEQELERLGDASGPASSEDLEARLKDMEEMMASHQQEEKQLLEETQNLKRLLEKSQEELAQTVSEHQKAKEELRKAQRSLPGQSSTDRSAIDLALDTRIREMGLLDMLPDKKQHRK